ncbi:MAG TPA: hypothetical protein VFQ23_15900, partial [Anaerolineales bacterium]|nr:hypothetical protein [Anaerolineales bacterium]
MPAALPRAKVKKNQTWNSESVFASPSAFDAEVDSLIQSLQDLEKFRGHLGENIDTFIDAMDAMNIISQRTAKIQVYGSLSSAVDTSNQQGVSMIIKAMSTVAQVSAATSFVDPELLAIGEAKLRQWLKDDLRMTMYEHYFIDLFRRQAHVRSAEVEQILGMLREPFSNTRGTTNLLANADFKFKPARNSKNKKVELTQ